MMRPKRPLPIAPCLVSLLLPLGACNATIDPSAASLEQSVPGTLSARSTVVDAGAMPRTPIVSLPAEAGVVSSSRSHAYFDGYRQDVVLKGSPLKGVENGMTILVRTSTKSSLDETTPLFKPTEAGIRSEIGQAFPHLAMQVVERPSNNAYGPYGLALGRASNGVRCAYAWQWIDQRALGNDIGLSGPIAIRAKLCRADMTFDALAALVNHLSIHRAAENDIVAEAEIKPSSKTARSTALKHVVVAKTRRAPQIARVNDEVAESHPTMPAAPDTTTPLAGDLPPQAYLGPSHSAKQN